MKRRAGLAIRFAGILFLGISCGACDVFFSARLIGVVRSPSEQCAATDEESLSGALVELTCPAGSGASVAGDGRATTDDKGTFTFETIAVHMDSVSACRLHVLRAGYKPLEGSIAELEPRRDRQLARTTVVKLRLQRSDAGP